jgi:hypothetical protein
MTTLFLLVQHEEEDLGARIVVCDNNDTECQNVSNDALNNTLAGATPLNPCSPPAFLQSQARYRDDERTITALPERAGRSLISEGDSARNSFR